MAELARLVDELLEFSKASLAKSESQVEVVGVRELCWGVSDR